MKILSVVGARPNFMKIAPFISAIKEHNLYANEKIQHILVHTGQHYDEKMSKTFFEALDIPPADINLCIGSGSHAEQVGNTMIAFEKVIKQEKPDWVVVVGDVNATCACSITAKKEQVRVAHIEAGLRSWDMTMPEEINRLVTDRLSDLLLTGDRISITNLLNEGVPEDKIRFVGNIMIDTLENNREKAYDLNLNNTISANRIEGNGSNLIRLSSDDYVVVTLHRPSNVDLFDVLKPLVDFLCDEVCADIPIVWPIHPRTQTSIKSFELWEKIIGNPNMLLLNPIGYTEMLRLNMSARVVLTDSGGLQEECCVLGTPCLTLRWNTERPITLKEHGGASILVGNSIIKIREAYLQALQEKRRPMRPELWDGKTAPRIIKSIIEAGL